MAEQGSAYGLAVGSVDFRLLHKQRYLVDFRLVAVALREIVQRRVIAAYYLLLCGVAAHLVVVDTESHHIDAHIGRRFVRIVPVNALEQGVEHRKYLYVAIIIDSRLSIRVEMEGVDHIDIVEIGGSGLVSDVHRVLQRQAPHRERFKLGISGFDASLMLVV